MNPLKLVLGIISICLLISILLGSIVIYNRFLSPNSKLIEISKIYRTNADLANNKVRDCDNTNEIESLTNSTTETVLSGRQKIIDAINDEEKCYFEVKSTMFTSYENFKVEIQKIDCNQVESSDKCQYLKDNINRLISELKSEKTLTDEYYIARKNSVYCILQNIENEDLSECTELSSKYNESAELLFNSVKVDDNFREYTKHFASL